MCLAEALHDLSCYLFAKHVVLLYLFAKNVVKLPGDWLNAQLNGYDELIQGI
jgi:hypothetical protein